MEMAISISTLNRGTTNINGTGLPPQLLDSNGGFTSHRDAAICYVEHQSQIADLFQRHYCFSWFQRRRALVDPHQFCDLDPITQLLGIKHEVGIFFIYQ